MLETLQSCSQKYGIREWQNIQNAAPATLYSKRVADALEAERLEQRERDRLRREAEIEEEHVKAIAEMTSI